MNTEDYIRGIFKGLERGDGADFFEHVDDKVDRIVRARIRWPVTTRRNPISLPEPSQSWARFCRTGLD